MLSVIKCTKHHHSSWEKYSRVWSLAQFWAFISRLFLFSCIFFFHLCMPLSSSPNKIETLWGVTFHSPTGRNNQKGQNVNSNLLPFSPFTVLVPGAVYKDLSVPGSHFFHPTSTWLDLHEPCCPLAAVFLPPHHHGVCSHLSGCLKSLFRITLCPSCRSPHCFLTRHALVFPLTSSLLTPSPSRVYPSLSLSVCLFFPPAGAAS